MCTNVYKGEGPLLINVYERLQGEGPLLISVYKRLQGRRSSTDKCVRTFTREKVLY